MLSLTYDDGPSRGLTPDLLALLRSEAVSATFFLLGRHAEQVAEIADSVAADGHEIGCHGMSHRHAWRVRQAEAIKDIEDGYRALRRWIAKDAIFRPPYGKLVASTRKRVAREWGPVGWWTIDSGDTWPVLPKAEDVVAQVLLEGGGVVLMHDFERTSSRAAEIHGYVLGLTELLIRATVENDIRIRPLGEIVIAQQESA